MKSQVMESTLELGLVSYECIPMPLHTAVLGMYLAHTHTHSCTNTQNTYAYAHSFICTHICTHNAQIHA